MVEKSENKNIEISVPKIYFYGTNKICLLYTSDAADDLLCVDLGGRRIIKKKTKVYIQYTNSISLTYHYKRSLTRT